MVSLISLYGFCKTNCNYREIARKESAFDCLSSQTFERLCCFSKKAPTEASRSARSSSNSNSAPINNDIVKTVKIDEELPKHDHGPKGDANKLFSFLLRKKRPKFFEMKMKLFIEKSGYNGLNRVLKATSFSVFSPEVREELRESVFASPPPLSSTVATDLAVPVELLPSTLIAESLLLPAGGSIAEEKGAVVSSKSRHKKLRSVKALLDLGDRHTSKLQSQVIDEMNKALYSPSSSDNLLFHRYSTEDKLEMIHRWLIGKEREILTAEQQQLYGERFKELYKGLTHDDDSAARAVQLLQGFAASYAAAPAHSMELRPTTIP